MIRKFLERRPTRAECETYERVLMNAGKQWLSVQVGDISLVGPRSIPDELALIALQDAGIDPNSRKSQKAIDLFGKGELVQRPVPLRKLVLR